MFYLKIYIIDRSREKTKYAELYFHGADDVEVVCSNFFDFMKKYDVQCVVSPANAFGLMDGGYDLAITRYFGEQLPKRVQKYILDNFYGEQPVATSFIVDAGKENKFLIHTPTMRLPEKIKDDFVIYQCMRTTLMCAYSNRMKSILVPFFGGGVGGVPPKRIAELMRKAYDQIHAEHTGVNWNNINNII